MYELANLIVCVLVPPAIDVRGATEGARAGDVPHRRQAAFQGLTTTNEAVNKVCCVKLRQTECHGVLCVANWSSTS
jgi:hypothetical protein